MRHIAKFSQQYAESGKALAGGVSSVPAEKLTCFATDEEVSFDHASHTYFDKEGNIFLSGSAYASRFEYEFNKEVIIPIYAKSSGLTEQEVAEYWEAKGAASRTFGTALHQALETYGKFNEISKKLDKPNGIHETFLPIVEKFFTKERLKEQAVYEPFVTDLKTRRCGKIDRLVITGDKECIIEDYKTNGDIYKQGKPKTLKAPYDNLPNQPISVYAIQLSFYKAILEAAGWTVKGLRVHHWDGKEWITIPLEAVEIN